MNKYGNKKAVRNGITFDSQKEAARYDQLMLRLCAGEIRDLKLQPEFTLQEAFTTPLGERVRAIKGGSERGRGECASLCVQFRWENPGRRYADF